VLGACAVIGIGSLSLAAAAMAQSMGGPSPGWQMFHHHHPGPAMGSPAMRQFRLAERLAGLEIYLAITPQQQPQWTAFTAAMMAMVPDRQPPAGDAFAAIDQITAKVEAMAQPAQHLHDAADALKAVLTPEQIGRANAIWATMHDHQRGGMWRHPGGDAPAAPGGAPKP